MSPDGNNKELCCHVSPPINLNMNDITAKQQHKAHMYLGKIHLNQQFESRISWNIGWKNLSNTSASIRPAIDS